MRETVNDKVQSGVKFRTKNGVTAIKDGIKVSKNSGSRIKKKPDWLRVKIPTGGKYQTINEIVKSHSLSTVCEESHCPNIGECWSHGTATIMLMGSVCTRACKFCSVDTGNPRGWLDFEEPENTARSVQLMNLKYVVLTSVDRDDLEDGGASHYAACIRAIKARTPQVKVEALTPDFSGSQESVQTIIESGLDVFAQNLETVERLTSEVRDPRAGYQQTLEVLSKAKEMDSRILTKSSLMLGLGESFDEIEEAMIDLRKHRVDLLTLGQYLRPTKNHLPIKSWISPKQFEDLRELALKMGFKEAASGPLVRSSYRADKIFDGNNLGLTQLPIKMIS
ncbi:MAG: lipoyl synthase [Candidatus Azotimanducaceae bacterium]